MSLFPILNDSFIKEKHASEAYTHFSLDGNYCIISLDKNIIVCSLFVILSKQKHHCCQINFSATSCTVLFHLMSQHSSLHNYISSSHLLYLGKEIYKANLARILHQRYVQL